MGVVVRVLRALAAALGYIVGVVWIFFALVVPIDELGECCQGTSEDLFVVGFGAWGVAGGFWMLLLARERVRQVRGEEARLPLGRHGAFVALIGVLWLLAFFGIAASDW